VALPEGTVTLVFTDIEGSTALLDRLGDGYGDVLFAHHRLLREVWAEHRGVEVDTEGDAFFVAFASAADGLAACAAAQAALAGHAWPHGEPLHVRMGVHTGAPRVREGRYWGQDVHYAARVASAAHGRQVLVSAATAALAGDAELASLGRHRLKDFPVARELFALGPGPHPAPRSLDPLRTNLPSAPSVLVGREAELDELVGLLRDEAGLVTVTGAGGIGKTRLALAVAERLVDRLADGAFVVGLSDVDRAEAVPAAIAAVFGVGPGALPGTLGGREVLLVLDNFEHVLGAATVVGDLVGAAPGLRVLVTSQAPLRVARETVVPLGPLTDREAAGLLTERARRAARATELADARPEVLGALCRELDGSPLAIELAAARLALLSPEELLERLRRSPDALGKGGRDLPHRQRGLRAAMQWSYGLLDPDAQALFRRLGHFAGEVSLERIESVCDDGAGDVLDALAGLVDLSLVRRRRDGRFELPQALRTFARELLDADGEGEALRRRHADALIGELLPLAMRAELERRPVADAVHGELADVTALLDWSAHADLERFARIAAIAYSPLNQRGLLPRLLEPVRQTLATGLAAGRVRVILGLAVYLACGDRRELDRADADYEGDAVFEGSFLATRAAKLLMDGVEDPGVGARVAERLAAWPQPEIRALAPAVTAAVHYARKEWDAAATAYEAVLAQPGRAWVQESALYTVGDCHLERGRAAEALRAYGRGVRAALEEGSTLNTGFQAEGVVAALADLGRPEEALEALGATDLLSGEGFRPRDRVAAWRDVLESRVGAARSMLGEAAADAAYARGAARRLDGAVAYLLEVTTTG
jgi:predicted ATPase/class 3 adenylate cyclase